MSGAISFVNGLRFQGYGIYQGGTSWVDEQTREAHFRYKFGYLGGVVGFDVDEAQYRTQPELEAGFKVFGRVEWRERDSSLLFRVLTFEPAAVDDRNLSEGFLAQGVMRVQHKYVGTNQQKQQQPCGEKLAVRIHRLPLSLRQKRESKKHSPYPFTVFMGIVEVGAGFTYPAHAT